MFASGTFEPKFQIINLNSETLRLYHHGLNKIKCKRLKKLEEKKSMEFFDDVDFDLLKITFWALKMHQNTSLDVQIFKISQGRSPGPPQTGGGHPLPYRHPSAAH